MLDHDRRRLENIKRKIAEKLPLDPDNHLNPCLTEEQVSGFERDYLAGGRLPEGYRLFLLEVSNGGFGPAEDYPRDDDLFGPMEPLPLEPEDWIDMERWHPEKPFPATHGVGANDDEELPEGTFGCGTLVLCSWGCGFTTELVVTGEEKGNVWYMAPTEGGALPELRPDGTRLDFLDWYDLWLEGRDEFHEMNGILEA